MTLRSHTKIARRLRRDATDAERVLWRALRESALPWKFRRQHPIGHYIADFACPEMKLAIEIDGGQHGIQQEADIARTESLTGHGYRVIRFWNNDVLENCAGVLEAIRATCESAPPHPNPLRPKGRRGR